MNTEDSVNSAVAASGEVQEYTPGPWRVERWSGGEAYRKGFYVARALQFGRQEWMQNKVGRARRFTSETAARAAIAKATGAKP